MDTKFNVIYAQDNVRVLDPEHTDDAKQLADVAGGRMSVGLDKPIHIAIGFIEICGGVTASGCVEF